MRHVFTLALFAFLAAVVAADPPAQAASAAKAYPLTTCIITGEKLGSMGKPYVFVHEGQEVKLCCKSCLKDFNKEPAKYLAKIKEATPKAKEESPKK